MLFGNGSSGVEISFVVVTLGECGIEYDTAPTGPQIDRSIKSTVNPQSLSLTAYEPAIVTTGYPNG